MNTTITSGNFKSPLAYLSELPSLFVEKITKRKIDKAVKLIHQANDEEISFLEDLNNETHIMEDIEKVIPMFKMIDGFMDMMLNALSSLKTSCEEDDNLHHEMIYFYNELYELAETNRKISIKMDEIHNELLSESLTRINTESIEPTWNGEDQLWDDFYKESTLQA